MSTTSCACRSTTDPIRCNAPSRTSIRRSTCRCKAPASSGSATKSNSLTGNHRPAGLDRGADPHRSLVPAIPFPAFSNEAAYDDHDVGKGDVGDKIKAAADSLGRSKMARGVAEHPQKHLPDKRRSTMAATLRLTHKAIGVEVRRGTYDIVVDGQRAGSVEMNDTIEIPIEPGRHTLQVRNGRNSSRTQTFDAAESQTVAFRCTGKSFLPIFLASFVVPSLAIHLRRTADDRSL